jgi:hypothetical protein
MPVLVKSAVLFFFYLLFFIFYIVERVRDQDYHVSEHDFNLAD